MADETTPTPEAPPTDPPPTPPEPAEKTVPYDRFAEVNKHAKQAQKQADEMATRLQELEDRDKSEIERERTARERAEGQLNETMARLERTEKRGWLRSAATQANFHDPADTDRIDLAGIESEQDAAKAVKDLAKNAQHLVRQDDTRPEIGQVVKQGHQIQPGQPTPAEQEAAQENQEFVDQLRQAADSGWVSSPGLLDR